MPLPLHFTCANFLLYLTNVLLSITVMTPIAANQCLNAARILSKNGICYLPISIPVRHHLGYIPMQGRLHPWDNEQTRVHRQVITLIILH